MKKSGRNLFTTGALALALGLTAACGNDEPENVDEAVDEIQDTADDAADSAGDAIDEAGDDVDDAIDDAADEVDEDEPPMN